MKALISLFGYSPFLSLQRHMKEVSKAVSQMRQAYYFYQSQQEDGLQNCVSSLDSLERSADQIKQEICKSLPRGVFLPVGKESLLEVLTIQDEIANVAQNFGVLLSLRAFEKVEDLEDVFLDFLEKNIEVFEKVKLIIDNLQDLLESSFGGSEAEQVKKMIERVLYHEYEADLLQRKLLKILFNKELPYQVFFLWSSLIRELGAIADLSEKLAYRLRMMLN